MKLNTINPGMWAEQGKGNGINRIAHPLARFGLLAGCLMFAGATHALAQQQSQPSWNEENPAGVAQVVALDECDPTTFNAALGPDFCKNIALGYSTKLSDLFAKAAAGDPDPNWDFEPDTIHIKTDTVLTVVDQGGEPHTFTEVKHFGGGSYRDSMRQARAWSPECAARFSSVAVAKTRILQGSQLLVPELSKGEHLFQCCIHPWMRVKVEVK